MISKDSLKLFYDNGEFIDFNGDGYQDFRTTYNSNDPWNELFLYNPKTRSFEQVKDFHRFVNAAPLSSKPGFYYSYRGNGCADAAWFSDLFVIREYTAIKLARINGDDCQPDKRPGVIQVRDYKASDKYEVIETLPLDTINTYKEYKWGFIKAYWNQNYKRFQ